MTPAAACAPPNPEPQRDDLVDYEQRAGAPRRLGHARQEVRRRRDDSARAQDGFEEDGGDLAAMAREHGLERRRVAVFGEHRAPALAGPFGLEVVVRSVIALARHQQLSAPGYAARKLRGQHPGLAARIAKAHRSTEATRSQISSASSICASLRAGHAVPCALARAIASTIGG